LPPAEVTQRRGIPISMHLLPRVGAAAARGQSRRQNAAAAQQGQQQQQAVDQQQQAAFGKARAACLEGRGYTVK